MDLYSIKGMDINAVAMKSQKLAEEKEQLEKEAKKEGRTLTNYILYILQNKR